MGESKTAINQQDSAKIELKLRCNFSSLKKEQNLKPSSYYQDFIL